jgi:hypothetical protein
MSRTLLRHQLHSDRSVSANVTLNESEPRFRCSQLLFPSVTPSAVCCLLLTRPCVVSLAFRGLLLNSLSRSYSCSNVLPQELTVSQLVKKFPAFYETQEVHHRIHKWLQFTPMLNEINHLTPNGYFSGRTAPLTYRCCIF